MQSTSTQPAWDSERSSSKALRDCSAQLRAMMRQSHPGASVSSDATTSDADASAGAKAAAGNALYLQVDIENGRLGMSFDSAFISTLIGMLGIDLGNITLPPIKSVKLDINLGESGFESINLNAQLDSVGTGANVAIKNVSLGFGESKD